MFENYREPGEVEPGSDRGPVIALFAVAAFVVPVTLVFAAVRWLKDSGLEGEVGSLLFAIGALIGVALVIRAFWSFGRWVAIGLAVLIYMPIMYYVLLLLALGLGGGT